jgi:hypothetical protein
MSSTSKYPYPVAQREFIEKIRAQVDGDDQFFHSRDWRCINPPGGRYCSLMKSVYADSFYVRPVAVWLPDRLIPGFTPTCPHCKSNRYVDLSKGRWQNSPKILYGLKGYRYLDTKLYPCHSCKRQFTGYNPLSMKEDSRHYMGLFNFHFSGRFAVDEELFSFICSNYETPTPKIHRILEQMAVDSYLNDYQLYLHAVRSSKVKAQKSGVCQNDRHQRTLHATMVAGDSQQPLSPNERTVRGLRSDLRSAKLAHAHALNKEKDRVCFKQLKRIKKARNTTEAGLPGVGVKKLEELMSEGINDARDLVDYAGVPPRWLRDREQTRLFERIRAKAAAIFEERKRETNRLINRIRELEEQLSEAEAAVELGRIVTEQMAANGEITESETPQPPLFSKMLDCEGYNGKVLSKDRIDCILMTDFLHRKAIQQSKMMGLGAEVLKVDFEYKIVKKVHVYSGVGKAFRPYKCLATVQNEDNQTVYYKICQGSEAIDEIKQGLLHLRERNTKEVRVIYVDNCCTVRQKLLLIFPNAVIKLDPFHWMRRWDPVLVDPNSEEAAIFRGLLRRAMFIVDSDEFARAKRTVKDRLVRAGKLGPNEFPKHRQIMDEARTVIPAKDVLEANVLAVLRYCYSIDFGIELKKALRDPEDTSPLPKPFFKPMSKVVDNKRRKSVSDIIATLLGHIKDDCLSDPPDVVLHRQNPKTKKIYCCRGTPSCENDNLHIDALTGKSIGIGRADRLLSTYFEVSNDRKRCNRNGETMEHCFFSHRTERFGMINSLHVSAGFKEQDIPFGGICQPALPSDISSADIGFDKGASLPSGESIADVLATENRTNGTGFVEDHETAAPGDDNSESEDDESVSDLPENDDDVDGLDAKLDWLVPEIRRKESTMDAFKRLTLQRPWIPFHSGTGQKTLIDHKELSLFESMKVHFNRHAPPRSPKGYYAFMTAWNLEVAERYRRQSIGEDYVTPINRKSIQQLQEHYDRVEAKLGMAARVEEQWEQHGHRQMDQLNDTLNQNRRNQTSIAPLTQAQPITYPQTGPRPVGNPAVLNPEIVAGALRARPQQQQQRQQVPYNVLCPQQTNINPLLGFKRYTWCITCGYRKSAHEPHERFGKPCLRDWCGNCFQLKRFHNNGLMGPHCQHQPHPTESQQSFWYN